MVNGSTARTAVGRPCDVAAGLDRAGVDRGSGGCPVALLDSRQGYQGCQDRGQKSREVQETLAHASLHLGDMG